MVKKYNVLLILFFLLFNSKAQTPTWADDVACIVYSHCSNCHNPNGSGPFSLLSYQDAVDHAAYMKIKVENNEMPPWPVDNQYRSFAHDRSLSAEEKATFIQWVNTGKAQGNMANAPAAPVFTTSLQIPNPDLKLKIPTYTVPTITEDLYRCFVLPTGLSAQKFITGIEIIPGNYNIVHHAQVFYDSSGICQTLDNNDPLPGYTSAGGVGTNKAVLLGTWVPGSSPIFVPEGMGKHLPANAKIVVQIHYPEYASGEVDSTQINFLFTSKTVRNISDAPILNHVTTMTNGPLFIPKNTVKTFYQEFLVPIDVTLLNIGPHGHLICTSMKAWGIHNGDTIPLIHIPHWDFHWQGSYDFPKPIKIPAGTVLYGEATYDNTINNPENPNDPPQDVKVGEATTDEMMLFYFSFLVYQNGDENIVIDSNAHKPHHLNCESKYQSTLTESEYRPVFTLSPNPVNHVLHIHAPEDTNFTLSVYNLQGKQIYLGDSVRNIDMTSYRPGIYMIHMQVNGLLYTHKIVVE